MSIRKPEPKAGFPHGGQGPKYLSHHLLPPIWCQNLELKIKFRHSNVGCDHPPKPFICSIFLWRETHSPPWIFFFRSFTGGKIRECNALLLFKLTEVMFQVELSIGYTLSQPEKFCIQPNQIFSLTGKESISMLNFSQHFLYESKLRAGKRGQTRVGTESCGSGMRGIRSLHKAESRTVWVKLASEKDSKSRT